MRYVGGSTAHGTALASGQAHGDAALDGAVYDLYAAEDITHPDGVTGVVDYSKLWIQTAIPSGTPQSATTAGSGCLIIYPF